MLATLLVATAVAAPLPDWALDRILSTQESLGATVLVAVAGAEAEALQRDAEQALYRQVWVLDGKDPAAELDWMLAGGPWACGFLLEHSAEGTLSLRGRGECGQPLDLAGPAGSFTPHPPTPVPVPPPLVLHVLETGLPDNPWLTMRKGTRTLNAEAFSKLVGDTATLHAYRHENNRVKLISGIIWSLSGTAATVGYLSVAGSHSVPVQQRTSENVFWGLEAFATLSATGALTYFIGRKSWLGQISHWYSTEEAQAQVDRYNADREPSD